MLTSLIIMKAVYVLQHVLKRKSFCEEVKLIGVYSSELEAKKTIEKLKGKPGFSQRPDGFHVDVYEIDKDHWVDGFID